MKTNNEMKILKETNINNKGDYVNLKNSVKSKVILKKIILFLNERQKLNLIKHNKEYLYSLNIDIEDFKNISGKIKIPGMNGYCKVYDLKTNKLIFEGQYLNEKKNGKGREYNNNGNLIFEGEYLNGNKNGKGKDYYDYGKIKFEGEYLNGKIWNIKGNFLIKDY